MFPSAGLWREANTESSAAMTLVSPKVISTGKLHSFADGIYWLRAVRAVRSEFNKKVKCADDAVGAVFTFGIGKSYSQCPNKHWLDSRARIVINFCPNRGY